MLLTVRSEKLKTKVSRGRLKMLNGGEKCFRALRGLKAVKISSKTYKSSKAL